MNGNNLGVGAIVAIPGVMPKEIKGENLFGGKSKFVMNPFTRSILAKLSTFAELNSFTRRMFLLVLPSLRAAVEEAKPEVHQDIQSTTEKAHLFGNRVAKIPFAIAATMKSPVVEKKEEATPTPVEQPVEKAVDTQMVAKEAEEPKFKEYEPEADINPESISVQSVTEIQTEPVPVESSKIDMPEVAETDTKEVTQPEPVAEPTVQMVKETPVVEEQKPIDLNAVLDTAKAVNARRQEAESRATKAEETSARLVAKTAEQEETIGQLRNQLFEAKKVAKEATNQANEALQTADTLRQELEQFKAQLAKDKETMEAQLEERVSAVKKEAQSQMHQLTNHVMEALGGGALQQKESELQKAA
jgi:hypothetical protein